MTNQDTLAGGVKLEAKALEAFTEYFVRNYPGPATIIGNPHWHAPKIFRAALYAIEYAALAALPATGAVKADGHKWVASKLGHGTKQCEYCHATFEELAALGELDVCANQSRRAAAPLAPSGGEPEPVADALERGLVLPKLANCGHYIAEDNTGQWHYINHANTWQTYPGPSTPLARSIADASPASPPKPSEAMVEAAARALAADELGMGDPPAVVATIVNHQWRAFERQARVALTAALAGGAR